MRDEEPNYPVAVAYEQRLPDVDNEGSRRFRLLKKQILLSAQKLASVNARLATRLSTARPCEAVNHTTAQCQVDAIRARHL
jgi:hypothetical protein